MYFLCLTEAWQPGETELNRKKAEIMLIKYVHIS